MSDDCVGCEFLAFAIANGKQYSALHDNSVMVMYLYIPYISHSLMAVYSSSVG